MTTGSGSQRQTRLRVLFQGIHTARKAPPAGWETAVTPVEDIQHLAVVGQINGSDLRFPSPTNATAAGRRARFLRERLLVAQHHAGRRRRDRDDAGRGLGVIFVVAGLVTVAEPPSR